MAHKVRITPEAEADLQSIGDHIALDAPERARRFLRKLRQQIATLKSFPQRHSKAPGLSSSEPILTVTYGMYRVLYTVEENSVTIHAVRHGARRPLRPDELPGS